MEQVKMALVNDEMMSKLLRIGTIIAAVCVVLFSSQFVRTLVFRRQKQRKLPLPPGPKPWPVIGNLLALGSRPHQALSKLAETYGPLMYLRLGSVPTIIVSSSEMAEQVLKTHDKIIASRPSFQSSEIMGYGSQNIPFMPYGEQWRHSRKLFTTDGLPAKRVEDTKRTRKEDVLLMLRSVLEESERGGGKSGVPMFNQFFQLSTNVVTSLSISKRLFGSSGSAPFSPTDFQDTVVEEVRLLGAFNIGDFIPSLQRFDLQGYARQMRAVHKKMDSMLQTVLDTRLEEMRRGDHTHGDHESKDYLNVLLTESAGKPMNQDWIKALLVDFLTGGTETTATSLEWTMAELLKNPTALRKCEEELDAVVGRARLVDEADLPELPFLRAVVKETYRLHPPAVLLVPHFSVEDCEVGGYLIPAQSRVLVNVWAIGRDPAVWDRPLEFRPQRFLHDQVDGAVDVHGRDFKLLPFGAGRRICPGRVLAVRVVQYTLAVMLQSCHWALPPALSGTSNGQPEELDMSEKFALSVTKAVGLKAIGTLKLPRSVVFVDE